MDTFIITKMFLQRQFGSSKYKWTTLKHNGVLFPPEYEPHNIPVIYEGENIYLEPAAEEAATFYAKYLETEYVKNRIFNKNFFNDWKKMLGKDTKIKYLDNVDFKPIYEFILKKKEVHKVKTK